MKKIKNFLLVLVTGFLFAGLTSCNSAFTDNDFDSEVADVSRSVISANSGSYASGWTISFDFNAVYKSGLDWSTVVLKTKENYLITMPNLDPWNSASGASLRSVNAYPGMAGTIVENGFAYDSAYTGSKVAVKILMDNTNGVRFYLNDKLAYTYPMSLWNGGMSEFVTSVINGLIDGTAVLNPGKASSITNISAYSNGGNSFDYNTRCQKGYSVYFDVQAKSYSGIDWDTQVLLTEDNYIITLANLDPWNNLVSTSKLKGVNAYPGLAPSYISNGFAWDSAFNGSRNQIRISVNTVDGIQYFINGKLAYTYPMTMWNGNIKEFVLNVINSIESGNVVLNPLSLSSIRYPIIKANFGNQEQVNTYVASTVTPVASASGDWTVKGDNFTHDPTMIYGNGKYYMFYTADYIGVKTSVDGKIWTQGKSVFSAAKHPSWWNGRTTGNEAWAPDVTKIGDTYFMYYCVSKFGTRESTIGLTTSKDLINWVDRGMVWSSTSKSLYNAIDPNLVKGYDGNYYLAFGSFSDGIYMIDLDPATMHGRTGCVARKIAGRTPRAIEAPHIWTPGNGWYYLIASYDLCCNGVKSTYNIRYGRSKNPYGPYVDVNGVSMQSGNNGGTVLLSSNGNRVGPGGQSVTRDKNGNWVLVYHYYDKNNDGRATIGINDIELDANGWIVLKKHVVNNCGFTGTFKANKYGVGMPDKTVACPPGQSIVTTYVNNGYGNINWGGAAYKITGRGGEYGVCRNDHFAFKGDVKTTGASLGWVYDSDWDWDNFIAFQRGAKVTVCLTNNKGTVDLKMHYEKDGVTHHQYYLGIKTQNDTVNLQIIGDAGANITYCE